MDGQGTITAFFPYYGEGGGAVIVHQLVKELHMHGPNSGIALAQCIAFMKQAHGDQVDLGGVPYWFHPVAVMVNLFEAHAGKVPPDVLKAALLHDVLEDTEYTSYDLESIGYSAHTVQLVCGLSKHPDQSYEDYIDFIKNANDPWLPAIKIADLRHNLAPERVAHFTDEHQHLASRYVRALELLTAKAEG